MAANAGGQGPAPAPGTKSVIEDGGSGARSAEDVMDDKTSGSRVSARECARVLAEELVPLQAQVQAQASASSAGERWGDGGGELDVSERIEDMTVAGVANFSLMDVDEEDPGQVGMGQGSGDSAAGQVEVRVLDEQSLSGLVYTPVDDADDLLGSAGSAFQLDGNGSAFAGGGEAGGERNALDKVGLSSVADAFKVEFVARVRMRLPDLQWSEGQEQGLKRALDDFIDSGGIEQVSQLQRMDEEEVRVALGAMVAAVAESQVASESQGAGSAARDQAGGDGDDYVVFDASMLGLVFSDSGSRVMIPGDGQAFTEELSPSPKLTMEAWQVHRQRTCACGRVCSCVYTRTYSFI